MTLIAQSIFMLANAQNLLMASGAKPQSAVGGPQSDPLVLLTLAALVLLGLFIWLAGLGLRKFLLPIIGLFAGAISGYLLAGNLIITLFLAAIGLIVAIIIAAKITAQSVKGQLLAAFIFSLCGTIIVLVGMILLLIYKGAEPINAISRRPTFYIAFFAAMTLFGTIVQTLFCKRPKKQSKTDQNADNS
jgi:uncharacterized membrane protein